MRMKPDYYLDTVHDVDFGVLKENNIETILLDIDNTLVPFKSSLPEEHIEEWIRRAKAEQFKICLVSNAYPRRAQTIGAHLDVPVVWMAKKPFKKGVVDSLKLTGTNKEQAVMIGDQIFTDILAAKLAGVRTILVEPMTKSDFVMTKFYRVLEFFVKRNLRKEKMR